MSYVTFMVLAQIVLVALILAVMLVAVPRWGGKSKPSRGRAAGR
jgi:hypothetical protein